MIDHVPHKDNVLFIRKTIYKRTKFLDKRIFELTGYMNIAYSQHKKNLYDKYNG